MLTNGTKVKVRDTGLLGRIFKAGTRNKLNWEVEHVDRTTNRVWYEEYEPAQLVQVAYATSEWVYRCIRHFKPVEYEAFITTSWFTGEVTLINVGMGGDYFVSIWYNVTTGLWERTAYYCVDDKVPEWATRMVTMLNNHAKVV